MKMPEISLLDWQKKFGTEKACAATLAQHRWPNGFMCPHCGYQKAYYMAKRRVYECCQCRHQTYITAGTPVSLHQRATCEVVLGSLSHSF